MKLSHLSYRRAWGYITFAVLLFSTQPANSSASDTDLLSYANIDEAHALSKGSGVVVAVADWQFNLSGESAKKYIGPVSMVPEEDIGKLKPWHGEWMSEIVHAVAPEASIIPIKCRGLEHRDFQPYLIEAIYHAADHGAAVLCSSMGQLEQTEELRKAIDYAEQHGLIFVDVHPEFEVDAEGKKSSLPLERLDKRIIHAGIVSVPDHPIEVDPKRDACVWPYDLVAHWKDGWGFSNGPPVVAGVVALMRSVNPDLSNDEVRVIVRASVTLKEGFPVLDGGATVDRALNAR